MARMVRYREIAGKKVVGLMVETRGNGRGGKVHEPTILLSDRSALTFVVEESEDCRYGVRIVRHPFKGRRKTTTPRA